MIIASSENMPLINRSKIGVDWQLNKFGQLIDASFRPIFSTKFEERRMDQQKYLPIEMQFYISVMFLGLPDDIH